MDSGRKPGHTESLLEDVTKNTDGRWKEPPGRATGFTPEFLNIVIRGDMSFFYKICPILFTSEFLGVIQPFVTDVMKSIINIMAIVHAFQAL